MPPPEVRRPEPRKRPRCYSCGERSDTIRRDHHTGLTQCDRCWFETDPARYGAGPEAK